MANGVAPRVVNLANNSPLIIIRDSFLTRVAAAPFFVNFKFGRTKQFPLIPENIPYCGVYIVGDNGGPDGVANHGVPRFKTAGVVGFTVWIANNDPVELENQLDGAFRTIMRTICEAPDVIGPDLGRGQVEAFIRYMRQNNYGAGSLNNETPVGETRLELTFNYTEDFYYIWPDDFLTMHMETRFPTPTTDPAEVQQIVAVWNIPQSATTMIDNKPATDDE